MTAFKKAPKLFVIYSIVLFLSAISSHAYADSTDEINRIRDLIPALQNGVETVNQDLKLEGCLLTLTAYFDYQYVYPEDEKTIKYGHQRTMAKHAIPLKEIDNGSIEIIPEHEITGIKACTKEKKKGIRFSSAMVFYDGVTTDQKEDMENCFEIYSKDAGSAQKIRKSLRKLVDNCK